MVSILVFFYFLLPSFYHFPLLKFLIRFFMFGNVPVWTVIKKRKKLKLVKNACLCIDKLSCFFVCFFMPCFLGNALRFDMMCPLVKCILESLFFSSKMIKV